MIPEETESVLDVGCGPGKLLHRIPIKKAFGTDLGRVGLKHVQRPVARSSIFQLPFADESVDLVLCAEVLEHLDPGLLPEAAAELYRVARKSVLVTVPYREQLLASHTNAPIVIVFHLHGHRQSLTEDSISVPSEDAVTTRFSWKVRHYWNPLLRSEPTRLDCGSTHRTPSAPNAVIRILTTTRSVSSTDSLGY